MKSQNKAEDRQKQKKGKQYRKKVKPKQGKIGNEKKRKGERHGAKRRD